MMCYSAFVRQRTPLVHETKSMLRFKILHSSFYNGTRLWCLNTKRVHTSLLYCSADGKPSSEITKSDVSGGGGVSTTLRTVKQTTKTASYTGVIIIGLGITGALLYTIFRELFSRKSPNSVYSEALERCLKDDKVTISLGEPIKGYGEQTRRGRRRHASHLVYEKDGVNYLRMKFYIKGSRRKATVHLEMKENARGKYEYRYLFVQLDDYPYTAIILEDNRTDRSSAITYGNNDSASLL